jgi:hypothetical protein
MKLAVVASALLLSGCASWMEIPSFWDDNEAYAVAKVRHSVDYLDCSGNYLPQARQIKSDIRFLELYASSKGSHDLLRMVVPMGKTAEGLVNKEENKVFCTLKKKQLVNQSAIIADATMERF